MPTTYQAPGLTPSTANEKKDEEVWGKDEEEEEERGGRKKMKIKRQAKETVTRSWVPPLEQHLRQAATR